MTNTFKENEIYSDSVSLSTGFVTVSFKVLKRTAKTVTVENVTTGEISRARIQSCHKQGVESLRPQGCFMNAPVLLADKGGAA